MSDENQLSPAERELETALRSLRPVPARIDPVAAACAASRHAAPSRMGYWSVAAAAAVIAIAGGAWLVNALREDLLNRVERHTPAVATELIAASDWPVSQTTFFVYRQALAESPAALDALLDQQSMSGSAPKTQRTPVSMLTVWNVKLRSLSGEM